MNNRGQSLALGIMSAIFVFIVGMMFLNFLMPEVATTRIALDCSNAAGITDGTKLVCLAIGTSVIYWIVLVFSLAIGFITARLYGA